MSAAAPPYAEVIGDPISHSKSPSIHRFWLEKLGIPGDFRICHVGADELAEYIAQRSSDPAWRGCSVTIPHKLAMLDHVSDPGDVRSSIGAINTVARDGNGALFGTNTDAAGFWAPIAELDLSGRTVVVVGSGGAARAVLFALKQLGSGPVTLLVRNPLKGSALLAGFGLQGRAMPLDTRLPGDVALLVNASSLGMTGQPPLLLDLAPLHDDALVYDLVYAPLQTALLAAAESRGLDTVDGLEMLVGQAAIAFELFFGSPAPRDHDADLRNILCE